jgi:hypothetical protein
MYNFETSREKIKSLSVSDFEAVLGEKVTNYVADQIQKYSFQYSDIGPEETESLLIKIVETLIDPNVMRSGEHRIDQWESGWNENFELFCKDSKNLDLLVPKYFNKYGAVRWMGKFIRPISDKFEYYTLAVILDWLFDKYLRNASSIYEFGCGTGHNLFRARSVNSDAKLCGLDWATSSQEIISRFKSSGIDTNISGNKFDYFNPDESFNLAPNSIVYTVASLEQVGDRWNKFIDYLLVNKPSLCIHIEPIAELLNPNKLIDNLSINYFKKRNYLHGFLDGLRAFEQSKKLKVHRAQRTHVGSLFIEGYSVVVWSPL